MHDRVPDGPAIRKTTEQLLRKADAYGRWPTRVDDIVAAAGLFEPRDSLLSTLVVEQAPAHVKRALRKITGRVLAVLDRRNREIHIDPSLHIEGQRAFKKLHEVGHDILPWQKALAYADDEATLSLSIRKTFEWQANVSAAELLFQGERFGEMASEYVTGIASVIELSNTVGSSLHATFRRFVEEHKSVVAGVVLELSPSGRSPTAYRRREVFSSQAWESRFGDPYSWPRILVENPFVFVNDAEAAFLTRNAIPSTQKYPDLNNELVSVNYEVFCNRYNHLVLIWIPTREFLRRRRTLLVPSAV